MARAHVFRTLIAMNFFAAAVAAPATAQVFSYRTACAVTVTGSHTAEGTITTNSFVLNDIDTVSFDTTYPIGSTTGLSFSGGPGGVRAEPDSSFTDGCYVEAAASPIGNTTYRFKGGPAAMKYEVNSLTRHGTHIYREGQPGQGGPITAESTYQIQSGDEAFVTQIPFTVPSGRAGTFTAGRFLLTRSANEFDFGQTVIAWQVFQDLNGNCVVDAGDSQVGGEAITVVGSGTSSGFQASFTIQPGAYVVRYTFFTYTLASAFTADCGETDGAGSEVVDDAVVAFSITP